MIILIVARSGDCFPNIISKGLLKMFQNQGLEAEVIHEIPFLMRSLPLNQKPIRWEVNLGFRVRQKIKYFWNDYRLKKKFAKADLIIVSECFANLFWKNFIYIEVLRKISKAKIVSYSDGPLNSAPLHKLRWLNENDFDESRFDYNLFLTDKIEQRFKLNTNQYKIGVNLCISEKFQTKNNFKSFKVLLDFDQPGFENERKLQLTYLQHQNIPFTRLIGKFSNKHIREIYLNHNILFLSFPETFGLSIGEALSLGCKIAIPNRDWVMSWDLFDELPYFFLQYNSENIFEILEEEKNATLEDRLKVISDSKALYQDFVYGNEDNLKLFLSKVIY
jgi:hypothetical protein